MSKKLKPCPFCGSNDGTNPRIQHDPIDEKFCRVICSSCGIFTAYRENEELAVQIWNRRVQL